MQAFLRRLLHRSSQKVNRVAAGSAVPAGLEPSKPGEPRTPTARERTLMRRRLRALRRRREALMREVGGLVLDSKHGENGAAGQLNGRTSELEAVDAEARALVQALEEKRTLDELVASGVSARCYNCGELVAGRERFCTNCGAQQKRSAGEQRPTPAPRSAPPSTPPAVVTGASSGRAPTPPAR
jgi:hypothetical protein